MATYSTDLTTLTNAEGGTWTEFDSPYNGAGSPAADGENFIQGTDCRSQTTGKANGLVISIVYDHGAGYTFATDEVVIAWCFYAVGVNLENYATGGWRFGIGSGTGTVDFYDIGGSDYGRNPYGGWVNVVVDPTLTSDYTLGGGNGSTYRYFGSVPYTINEISKGTPSAMDAIRAGRGEISITGTGGSFVELASYNDWNSTATPPGASSTVLDSGYHRLGLFQDNGGTFLWKGLLSLGLTGTTITLTDSNQTILIEDAAKTYLDFNKVEINNAGSAVTLTNITFIALGTVSPGTLEMVDNATVDLIGCSFNGMDVFTFQSNATIDGCVFNGCTSVTTGGGSFDGCAFNELTAASAVIAATPAEAASIQNSSFNSDGTGNGLEIGGTAANITLTGLDFAGYSTTVDANKAIFVNIATGSMTINISGGSGVTADSHVRTAGCTVTVSADVSITFDKMKDDTEVRVYENTTVENIDISFTATDTIASASSEFGVFAIGDEITIRNSDNNDGSYKILTASASTLTVTALNIITESAGANISIKKTNQVEIDGIEDVSAGTADNRSFTWASPAATIVDYVIHHWSGAAPFYQTIRVNGYVVPSVNTTININQLVNRNAS